MALLERFLALGQDEVSRWWETPLAVTNEALQNGQEIEVP
jgi:hypothetical protein